MKKHLLIVIISLLITGGLSAQETQQFYVRMGFGTSLATASNLDQLYNYSSNGSAKSVSIVPVGFGRGFNGVAAFGYKFSKYVSVEMGLSQFIGLPKIADSVNNLPGGVSGEARLAGNMLSLIPSVVIRPGLSPVDPYARIGFILGVRPTINAKADFWNYSVNPSQETVAIRHYYGGVAAGLQAAVGVSWEVNTVISLYAEFAFNSISYSPMRSEIILYEQNGVDKLSELTLKQKETEYYNNINPDEEIPSNSPDKKLRTSLPFSNAGVNFGISFHF